MKLRTSNVLKLFAILLFSLESLAPTVFSSPVNEGDPIIRGRFEKVIINHPQTLSLFAEACDVEERDDINTRHLILSTQDAILDTLVNPLVISTSGAFFPSTSERLKSNLRLFQFICAYRI